MKCFSMQKLRKRYNGAEQAGSIEENAGADADAAEVSSSPVVSASSSSARTSFRSRVRAIQNAQRFISNNPKLRASHPSCGSRECKNDALEASSPLLPLGGRARSATELGSALFDVAAAYRMSSHGEATCARLLSGRAAHLPPLADDTCSNSPVLQPLPSPSQVLQKFAQPSSAYRLPLPSRDAHITPSHPVLPLSNTSPRLNSALLLPVDANCPISGLQPLPPPNRDTPATSPLRRFNYEELMSACQNFALDRRVTDANVCFNGTIKVKGSLKAGKHQDVVVLVLKDQQKQGIQEWMSKVSSVAHELHEAWHVCKLIGFYGEVDGHAECMLVYERLKKGTLFSLLFETSDNPPLEWLVRMKIAYGAAQGLATLHEKFPDNVLYEDFRASSIHVDHDYSSKVSLYGIVNPLNHEINTTSSKARVNAYRAPETVSRGELTLKSNVWSFGVVLLELLSGKKNLEEETTKNGRLNLVKWAKPFLVDKGKLFLLMDPKLQGKFSSRGAKMVSDLALTCLRRDPTERPTMREALDVVRDVYDSKYTTRCSAKEPIAIRKSASSSSASLPISGSPCLKPSSTNQQRPSLHKTLSIFEVVENPPLKPLIIPPRCGGEDFVHHHLQEYSPAPLTHVKF